MSSSASRLLLQPPMKTRTPLFSGSKQSPATENLADGPLPIVVTFVHTPVSANIGRWMTLSINIIHKAGKKGGKRYVN